MGRSSNKRTLISADQLRTKSDDVRIIDCRWYLGEPGRGRRAYEDGHIPGAVHIDVETDINGREGDGRHPLPTRAQLESAMRAAGVSRSTGVVVYDDAGGSVAARLWWLLRIHGHEDVAVLDGGIQAWDGPLESGGREVAPGDFTAAAPEESAVLRYDDVRQLTDAVVLDVRAPERYRGETEPVDPIAGHIPGARNAFWKDTLMASDGRLLPPDELRRRFDALGVHNGNVVVHCGSGVVACQTLLALEHAGFDGARIYAGGWSDWSNRPGAPVATGEE